MYVPSSRPSASIANVQSPTSARAWFDAMQVLTPVFDPLQRAAEAARRERDDQLLARREELLPEAAADVVRLDANEMRRHAGDACERVLGLVRVLRAHPHVQRTRGRLVRDDDAPRLHREPACGGAGERPPSRRAASAPSRQRLQLGCDRKRHLGAEVRAELGMHDGHVVGSARARRRRPAGSASMSTSTSSAASSAT